MNPQNENGKKNSLTTPSNSNLSPPRVKGDIVYSPQTKQLKKFNYNILWFALGFAVVCIIPYKYNPGGKIELLPPKQKEIQADISGRITEVSTVGGDGAWIKKGTVIAKIEPSHQLNPATPIKDDLSIIQENIESQEANLAKEKSNLNKLLSTPRKEEVDVSQAQLTEAEDDLEVAKQKLKVSQREVDLAEKTLQVEVSSEKFKSKEALRQKELADEGVVSAQDYDDAQREAQVAQDKVAEAASDVKVMKEKVEEARLNVKTQEKAVMEKNSMLSLTLSGPHPDEIQSARHTVEIAESKLRETKTDLESTKKQLVLDTLNMPFDGRIITPFLDQKVGTYIEQGNTFATSEDDRNARAQMRIAETDVGQFDINETVTVKLLAYPDQKIKGKVISIEPTTTEELNNRYVNVIVELPNLDRLLKTGMTGHAKIEGERMPAIVVFTRPLVRFFQVEVWSWIP